MLWILQNVKIIALFFNKNAVFLKSIRVYKVYRFFDEVLEKVEEI